MSYWEWVDFLRGTLPQIKDEVIFEIAKEIEQQATFDAEDAYQEGYDQGCQDSANDF